MARLLPALHTHGFGFSSEEDLQTGIASALEASGIAFEREVRLSGRDRIDFLVGAIGVEVKTDGTLSALLRQLSRYAEHRAIGQLVVVTNRARLTVLPPMLRGKGLFLFSLLGANL